jgi:hypothetical protein
MISNANSRRVREAGCPLKRPTRLPPRHRMTRARLHEEHACYASAFSWRSLQYNFVASLRAMATLALARPFFAASRR